MRLERALLLSGSLGKGHDVVAEACGMALGACGVEWRILDSMALLGRGPGAAGDWVFRKLLSVTAIYDAFHFSQLRDNGRLGQAADRAAINKMHAALAAQVSDFRPDVIVSVFATGAGATARLKQEGLRAPSVVIMTDSFAHQMWVHEHTDLFLVTSSAAAESVRRYWPEARIEVMTAPVRSEFYAAPARSEARRCLGVPEGATCALLMSGAWGLGPLDQAARALAEDGIWALAVAGTNKAMEASLEAVAATHPQVIPFGFTDRVPELMAAADVVVTSSGDTCREARTIGRGIILIDVVPGHGRENLMHELELGGATACLPTAGSIARSVRSFLDDAERSKVTPALDAGVAEAQFLDALRRLGLEL
ncbi:MAG: glycosyl hydrolase [Actinomycetota bacterium]|nr:glycosyl hydrolase [Actinomycetota bacterium]